jgi:hypothetical protein
MSQQLDANNLTTDSDISVAEAWDLLFGEDANYEDIRIEGEANCTVGAGFDWGKASGFLMLNTGLLHRLNTLRISLNREAKLLLSELNLGVGAKSAYACVRERILEKLQLPTPSIQEHLQAVLLQDDLYREKFISNREVLRCSEGSGLTPAETLRERPSLLKILLTDSDWETIAVATASSVREQVLSQTSMNKKVSV